MICVDQDYGILIFFIKTALKMQEIEFQSLRNPWMSLEVSHSFGNYSWNLLDRPCLDWKCQALPSVHIHYSTIYLFLSSWEENDSQPFW